MSPINRIFGPLCHADSSLESPGPDIRVLFSLCVYLRHLWIMWFFADDADTRSYRTDERDTEVKRDSLRYCGFLQFLWTAMIVSDDHEGLKKAV
ncbi:MAG TPA: hypothetical protein PLC72_18505, partial [Candidatus Hydrogenedentes bacterium]|nr:hypothetical protein [Candidatus Hydrogenedentota bacterium]